MTLGEFGGVLFLLGIFLSVLILVVNAIFSLHGDS